MILVYTPKKTNRIRYSFNLIFSKILKCELSFTTNVEEFKSYVGPKINYSKKKIDDEIFFLSSKLLLESGIFEQEIHVVNFEETIGFYQTGPASHWPFDPFAASFFLATRYEEYLPHIMDIYDRFNARESVAFKNNFLDKPVINIWAKKIQTLIQKRYPDYKFPAKRYKYISTIDIDNAYAYLEKGFLRTLGGYLKSIFTGNWVESKERTAVIFGSLKDPYDTYQYQHEINKKFSVKPIYFFLVADYGFNDKNVPVTSKKFQSLIKLIADSSDVGIHPSFGSNQKIEKLFQEKRRLTKILKREVTKSRQHFLKFTFPYTFRNLIERDITDDYSLGYASEVGFRAGLCSSYNFYDLDLEVETKLSMHPFAVMEATLKYYLKLSPAEAVVEINKVIEEIKKVDGTFISLWHNETLSEDKNWVGWRYVYEKMLEKAVA
ncbi:MAG: hypothetical protein HRT72_04275 [Flavobacteriales bacterium]|nr:hypothetical protein [Flavobacteriales bacterium]